uniref:Uncharacterized protein n=1 Tax=Rhizophora mucronata TaxID=61149 RepID=A0A2P2JR92_RHIMU
MLATFKYMKHILRLNENMITKNTYIR